MRDTIFFNPVKTVTDIANWWQRKQEEPKFTLPDGLWAIADGFATLGLSYFFTWIISTCFKAPELQVKEARAVEGTIASVLTLLFIFVRIQRYKTEIKPLHNYIIASEAAIRDIIARIRQQETVNQDMRHSSLIRRRSLGDVSLMAREHITEDYDLEAPTITSRTPLLIRSRSNSDHDWLLLTDLATKFQNSHHLPRISKTTYTFTDEALCRLINSIKALCIAFFISLYAHDIRQGELGGCNNGNPNVLTNTLTWFNILCAIIAAAAKAPYLTDYRSQLEKIAQANDLIIRGAVNEAEATDPITHINALPTPPITPTEETINLRDDEISPLHF